MTNEQTRACEILDKAQREIESYEDVFADVIAKYHSCQKDLEDATALVKTLFRSEPGTNATTHYFEIRVSKPIESITYDTDALAVEYPNVARQAVVEVVDKAKMMQLVKQGAISNVELSKFAKVEKRAPSVTIKLLPPEEEQTV